MEKKTDICVVNEIIVSQQKTKKMNTSYWNSNGELQEDYDRLYKELVPAQGAAQTIEGELIRSISRLYWDYCNNGNGNAVETEWEMEDEECSSCYGSGYYDDEEEEMCDECCGSGELEEEVEGETEITPFFQGFIDFIKQHTVFAEDCTLLEKQMIMTFGNCKFDNEEMAIYDKLTTQITKQVLSKNNVYTEYKPESE